MDAFDIPVVLFLFRRKESALQVLDRVRMRAPRRLYLLSDAGRNYEERSLVAEVRSAVEAAIDWDCEVIKHYAQENRGVFENIGMGAQWVFEREPCAIFLEDDNVPEVTFFDYCRELLHKYEHTPEVLWICGTNYLESFEPANAASYMFTRHLLPCGWASWGKKFNHYYDVDLASVEDPDTISTVRSRYENKGLFQQQLRSIQAERQRFNQGQQFISWDYHMAWTLRKHNLLGISPGRNQIRNIGADEYAEHGGTSLQLEMTRRFCGMDSIALDFPLQHPPKIEPDRDYEQKIAKIILLPASARMKTAVRRILGKLLRIDGETSITSSIRDWLRT
ncbi:glycosyltransferase family 2 protein [Enteractinococcus coprophilus]|uniref:Hemolytic protein HlpA-like protein n=1 Tax=Enteractinococcus coprophilus TaxID=1027633 RepID=A0A543AMR1_9MICC|nr:glycosyltransferase family 2 protein [Enteractinococcus coprophilus]TQL73848.1 hypothetical protein FB556_0296 [Enteractinococcus coprophilus]